MSSGFVGGGGGQMTHESALGSLTHNMHAMCACACGLVRLERERGSANERATCHIVSRHKSIACSALKRLGRTTADGGDAGGIYQRCAQRKYTDNNCPGNVIQLINVSYALFFSERQAYASWPIPTDSVISMAVTV